MEIRKCTNVDIDRMADFYDEVVLFLTQNVNWPRWKYQEYPSRASVVEDIAEGSQYACFDDDGAVIGAFVINTDPRGAYHKGDWTVDLVEGEYSVIHSFAVRPDLYGRGIGPAMVAYCKRLSREAGFRAIRVDVVPTNLPAAALYRKEGFAFVGERDLERGFEDIPTFCLYEFNL